MNNDKFTHLGFWGTVIPAKSSLAVTPPDNRVLKISSASLDLKHSEKSKSSLVIVDSAKKQEFVVCTLTSRQPSSHLDLFFVPGGKITFKVVGDCSIHLTGYTTNVEDFGPGDEDESGSDLDLPRDVQDLKSIVQDLSGEAGESDSDDAALIPQAGKAAKPAARAAKAPAKAQKAADAQAGKGKAKQQEFKAHFDEESDEELDAESMEVAAGLAAQAKAALGDDFGEEESSDEDEVSELPGAKRPRPSSVAPAAKKAKTDAGATPAKPAQGKQKGKPGKGSQKPAATPAAKGASPKGPQGKAGGKPQQAKQSQKQQTPAKPAGAGAKGAATPDSGSKQSKAKKSKAKTVKCPQCPKMFASEAAVQQHSASAHKSA